MKLRVVLELSTSIDKPLLHCNVPEIDEQSFCISIEKKLFEFSLVPIHDEVARLEMPRDVSLQNISEYVEIFVVRKSLLSLSRVIFVGQEVEEMASVQHVVHVGMLGILDCVPFDQGFITSETLLCRVEKSKEAIEAEKKHVYSSMLRTKTTTSGGGDAAMDGEEAPLFVSKFMQASAAPDFVPMRARIWYGDEILSEECIGAPLSLFRRLGVFSGTWGLVRTKENQGILFVPLVPVVLFTRFSIERLVKLVLFEECQDFLFVSPILMLNILSKGDRLCQDEGDVDLMVRIAHVDESRFSNCPPRIGELFTDCTNKSKHESVKVSVAKSIKLSPVGGVQSAHQLHSVRDHLLSFYFSSPKLLYTGDLICCKGGNLSALPSTSAFAPYSPECEYAYWKVASIETKDERHFDCAVVLRDACSLYEEDSQQQRSFLPRVQPVIRVRDDVLKMMKSWFGASQNASHIVPSMLLHSDGAGFGKQRLVHEAGRQLGVTVIHYSCWEIVSDIPSNTHASLTSLFESAQLCSPCILLLSSFEALSQSASHASAQRAQNQLEAMFSKLVFSLSEDFVHPLSRVALVATTDALDRVAARFKACFLHRYHLGPPSDQQRRSFFKKAFSSALVSKDVSLKKLVASTRGFSFRNLSVLISIALQHVRDSVFEDASECCELVIRDEDLDYAAKTIQSHAMKSEVGAPDIPDVKWEDIGGMQSIRSEILDTISLPLEHPELFSKNGGAKKRSGVLLYGPPGTGKTLIAKAVATECGLAFISVKGPELINMYVGESERNVRQVFLKARAAAPCVVFMDELDSLAPRRGMGADSGGVMDRIVSQLLSELDGMGEGDEKEGQVFVIGATNRPDLLDPSLLRPGRLDRLLFCGTMTTPESQCSVLKALTRKFNLSEQVDLLKIAQQIPLNFTGADCYALCSGAWLSATKREIESGKTEGHVIVEMEDFEQSMKTVSPSVSLDELDYYQKLRNDYSKN